MVRKHLPLFQLVLEVTDLQRKAIIKTLSEQQLHAIAEAIYNVLNGVCPLSPKDKKTLFDYRIAIRRMVSKVLTRKQRQRILNKYQEILPLLLKPVIRLLKSD